MTYTIEDVVTKHWKGYTLFSRLEYSDGVITGKFNSDLKEHLLELTESFTLYEFREFRRLRTSYSQQMFRFLKSWQANGEIVIPIGQLHDIFSVTNSLKANFKDFRRRVLEPCQTEILEKTSFLYSWEPLKNGRAVAAIRFTFGTRALEILDAKTHTYDAEIIELQSKSSKCYYRLQRTSKPCLPRPRSKVCQYCQSRGQMSVPSRQKMLLNGNA
jgi:plasmid replication initiation protein